MTTCKLSSNGDFQLFDKFIFNLDFILTYVRYTLYVLLRQVLLSNLCKCNFYKKIEVKGRGQEHHLDFLAIFKVLKNS